MMKSRVAGAGVRSENPAPLVAPLFVWHPATAKLTAKVSSVKSTDLSIVLAPLLDEGHRGRPLFRNDKFTFLVADLRVFDKLVVHDEESRRESGSHDETS